MSIVVSVVDSLLDLLSSKGYYTQGYANDMVVRIQGWYRNTVENLMKRILFLLEGWYLKNLRVNMSKMTLVPLESGLSQL